MVGCTRLLWQRPCGPYLPCRRQVFKCHKEKVEVGFGVQSRLPRYLLLTGDRFIVLEAHPFKVNVGIVKSNHHLAELANLTYKKSEPTRVVLKMKASKVPGEPDQGRVFHLPDAVAFQRAIVQSVQRLASQQ